MIRMKKIAIVVIFTLVSVACSVSAEEFSAAQFTAQQTETKTFLPILNKSYKNSRLYVGAKINPNYKIDCRETSVAYDPYYCGPRTSPEVVKFNVPRAGVTFTF